ncbi:RNA-splicing ligase RtcB [Lachnoclostridium sp. An169]|uniref:RtcB family protein n=1 Tax=Lachnoclostridium sp. An169 TaxID=1965569 RepID=UPI000B3685F2|nr:RtcB family protein [Lachnoclostridium sp. An169]OUP80765.1 RNA-splicing ligase RtcB [Lachnoclostridium sp. An169]
MKTVDGIYASANIFTDTIEDYALSQIRMLCDNEAFENSRIRIMPDVHPGKVGTIGFTATVGKRILPNVIGVDIGCGITVAKLKQKKAEFRKMDSVIRKNIPAGTKIRRTPHRFAEEFDFERLNCCRAINKEKARHSLGSLGGGNHFIELDQDSQGGLYVVIHSGSRHLGNEATEHYLKEGQKILKSRGEQIPYELTYLEGDCRDAYLEDLQTIQEFAALNRAAILDELVRGMKWKMTEKFSSVHNYIDGSGAEMILRKGAVSANAGEKVIIPINMRDGVILGTGLGNPEWNYSAPHGAGRIMKREDVKQKHTVSEFKKEMKGIYSSCIGAATLDEAPFAYRGIDEILGAVKDTVEIRNILKPVYNYKAGKN